MENKRQKKVDIKNKKMYNEKNYVLNGDENEDNIYNKS